MSEEPRPRRRLSFKQQEVVRAIRAAIRAGLAVERTRIKPDGEIVLEHVADREVVPHDNLDRELAEFEARHGEG